MSDRSDRHPVLYWNRATPELYAVIREQAPPELEPVFIETEDAGRGAREARAGGVPHHRRLGARPRPTSRAHRASAWSSTRASGTSASTPQALAARKIPLCLCPAGTATGVGEHTMTLILAVLKQVVLAHNALVQGKWLQWTLGR